MSLKRCLSAVESISDHSGTSLFVSAKSETPMDVTSRLSLTSSSDPGSTPDDPIILFAKVIGGESERLGPRRPETALLPPQEGSTPFKAQFWKCFIFFTITLLTKIYFSQCTTEFILKMEPSYRNSPLTSQEIFLLGASTSTQ
jgi:hypothetical protein